ncbi:hypothetical protein BU14_0158s0022 [Porphyra umbilicalis]|uniref:Uncharacterized protein n=1 Tax=Porphyra umbilicalis TaxID=2786 RepID=A0A1X6P8S0_PORUM|nr:hypothetical protein BU14_0158s0022 [Porphyra umbilicalis]|eukprot:OSX77217.1 hypothetical protein BU14_0158s0022 [Porphyra umbilicalis]
MGVSTTLPPTPVWRAPPPRVHTFRRWGPPLLIGGLAAAHLQRPGVAHPPLVNGAGHPLVDQARLRALEAGHLLHLVRAGGHLVAAAHHLRSNADVG